MTLALRKHFWKYVTLVFVLALMIGPLVVPFLGAFKGQGEAMFGPEATVIPRSPSLSAFGQLIDQTNVVRAFFNSLFICLLLVVSRVAMATMGGYMLSRPGWKGRGFVTTLVLSAIIFPFESIMVSLFAQVRDLGLFDTPYGVWLPGVLAPFQVLLMRAAFMGVPGEMEDAALLDGANEWKRFRHVFLPQVKGAITIVGLTSFIDSFEDYLWPLVVLRSDDQLTLMLAIARLQSSFGFDYRVVLAGAIIALVPVLIIFFLAQRYFFRGIQEGGLKF